MWLQIYKKCLKSSIKLLFLIWQTLNEIQLVSLGIQDGKLHVLKSASQSTSVLTATLFTTDMNSTCLDELSWNDGKYSWTLNGILLSSIREWNSVTFRKIDGTRGHFIKLTRSDTEKHAPSHIEVGKKLSEHKLDS